MNARSPTHLKSKTEAAWAARGIAASGAEGPQAPAKTSGAEAAGPRKKQYFRPETHYKNTLVVDLCTKVAQQI